MARSEERPDTADNKPDPSVADLAELYLGNILYALERCAMSFDDEGSADHAAFYRGIARKLAEAHGKRERA